MKILLLAVLAFQLSFTPAFSQEKRPMTNATNFDDLNKDLSKISKLIASGVVGYDDISSLEWTMRKHVDAIYLDINTRLPKGYGNTTLQWREYIDKLGEALDPHETTIIESAYRPLNEQPRDDWQLHRVSPASRMLIDFIKPDLKSEEILRNSLKKYPKTKWLTYRNLLELRLLKESDIRDMEVMGSSLQDPKEKIKWAEEVSFYGSEAGLNILEEIISKPFDPSGSVNEDGGPENNKSFASYVPVGRAVRFLGIKASTLLPAIKERQHEVFTEYERLFGSEFAERGIMLFKEMDLYISGKTRPYPSARNGSGLLYLPGEEPTEIKSHAAGKNQIPEKRPSLREETGEQSRDETDSDSNQEYKVNAIWYFIPISLILLFIVILKAKKTA